MENKKDGKKENIFTGFVGKVADIGKKAADGVHKSLEDLSEKKKIQDHEKRLKKYNPLFKETFESGNFKLPNIIKIVDDAVRKDVDVCEGAIGWTEKVKGVEFLYLYDEFMNNAGITFLPFAKCDSVYCVDNFDRKRFINVETIFERTLDEKIAELEHIAFSLGAKSFSVEIVTDNAESSNLKASANAGYGKIKADASYGESTVSSSKQSGKSVSFFSGHLTPVKPTLKWFKHDDTVKRLIDMRTSNMNSIKSKVLELKCSSAATMSQSVAAAVDTVVYAQASGSFVKETQKEQNSKIIYEIEF